MAAIDTYAREIARERFGLPPCLHVPIAARSEAAIRKYIGPTSCLASSSSQTNAFIVELDCIPELDPRLPIWSLDRASTLHAPRQVWVHVDYRAYRRAYAKAFPKEVLDGHVLDHVLNRRVARLKGFAFLRIVAVSRSANSSSGGLSEKWAVAHHSTPKMRKRNRESPAQIQYADLADLVKMLDMKTGGALQDPVNLAQSLLRAE